MDDVQQGPAGKALRQHQNQPQHQHRLQKEHNLVRPVGPHHRPFRKHQNKRQQIQGQRNDPQERDRRQVGADVGDHAEHQAGRRGPQQYPAQTPPGSDRPAAQHQVRNCLGRGRHVGCHGDRGFAPAAATLAELLAGDPVCGLLGSGCGCGCGGAVGGCRNSRFRRRLRRHLLHQRRSLPDRGGTYQNQHAEQTVHHRPAPFLLVQRQVRFDEYRIGQQSEQAADVAGDGEKIRILGRLMAGVDKPALQQGRTRGHHEEGQTDQQRQQSQRPRYRITA